MVPGFAEYRPGEAREPVEVKVRPATAGDLDHLTRIQIAAGRESHPDHDARAVADPGVCVLVAEVGGWVAGWGTTSCLDTPADLAPAGHYLGGVTVEPDWRRRGIALALTDARLRWIAGRADEAYYVVNASNRASIDLHRRWGFLEVARGPSFAGIPFDGGLGLLMRADVVGLRR